MNVESWREERAEAPGDAAEGGIDAPMFDLGGDERRMHVRAYNHWVSLLHGRAYPAIGDLEPANIADFSAHAALLDFTDGIENPGIAYLGRALREECGLTGNVAHIDDVPARSLLSRLTDHYLQIIANRAPIGFEAEFVSTRGCTTLYRGILMPFSSDGEQIDYIYGVINWKELVDAATHEGLTAELAAAARTPSPGNAVWADGPGHAADPLLDRPDEPVEALVPSTLADYLAYARDGAAQLQNADSRTRTALVRALARAHDFARAAEAQPERLGEMLADAGIVPQARAPMTGVVKLVFGPGHDKTRLTEYATVLGYARRCNVPAGELPAFLAGHEGGIKAVVASERALRRPANRPDLGEQIRADLRQREPLATLSMAAGASEFVVLLGRANARGMLDVVARCDLAKLVDTVVRRAA